MGRKKVLGAEAQEVAEVTPFCYYCDREFDDVKTLVLHQRTKHFCCAESGRTFSSVTSLRVHMLNSYKKSLKEVPNAMPGRENPDVVVHGMDGLPQGILEERMQKSKADADEKLEEEKEQKELPKSAPKADPSPRKSALQSASPEPESQPGQKQVASPETGHVGDLIAEPSLPKLEEEVDAALDSLPPALKLLVPELVEDTPQCEGLPGALASLHSIAVQALASFGLLQPGSYGGNKMEAALHTAVAALKQPKAKPVQPTMPDVPNTAPGPSLTLPAGFMPPMVAGPVQTSSLPLRPLGPAPMGCFPAQFPSMQGGPMAAMPNLGPGRPPAAAHPPGYVPSAQGIACGGCAAQPMQLPFGVQSMTMGAMPAVGGRQIGGPPTMPLGMSLPQLSGVASVGMEPAEKRAKIDVG